jgi:hypothetical protein
MHVKMDKRHRQPARERLNWMNERPGERFYGVFSGTDALI